MAFDDIERNREAEADAAFAGAALEGGKEMLAGFRGEAGACVDHVELPVLLVLVGADENLAGFARSADGFAGVADEVGEYAEHLLAIKPGHKRAGHVLRERDIGLTNGEAFAFEHIFHQIGQLHAGEFRRGFFGFPEGEGGLS